MYEDITVNIVYRSPGHSVFAISFQREFPCNFHDTSLNPNNFFPLPRFERFGKPIRKNASNNSDELENVRPAYKNHHPRARS